MLTENWKSCETWRKRYYQLLLETLEQCQNTWEKRVTEQRVRGRIETIQTAQLFKSAQIHRINLETWRDLLPLKFQWKAPVRTISLTMFKTNIAYHTPRYSKFSFKPILKLLLHSQMMTHTGKTWYLNGVLL